MSFEILSINRLQAHIAYSQPEGTLFSLRCVQLDAVRTHPLSNMIDTRWETDL